MLLQDGLEVQGKNNEMKRVLGLFQLASFGIAAIVGGGIFVVTGLQAKMVAGWVAAKAIYQQQAAHWTCHSPIQCMHAHLWHTK